MNPVVKRFGNIAGFFIIPLLIAAAIYLVTYRRFDLPIIAALIALGICVVAFVATNPEAVIKFLGARWVRSWVISLITVVAVIGILVLVNVLVARVPAQIDNTASKTFTIDEKTAQAVSRIQEPVKVLIFFTNTTASTKDQAVDQLKAYQARTDKITVELYDINAAVGKVNELRVNTDPLIVFQSGTRREDVTTVDEQSFTRAILRLQQKVEKRVFFTAGHGERTTSFGSQTGQEGLSEASTALTNNNYKVNSLNLLNNTDGTGQAVQLNPSTDIIVLAAPTAPFQDSEKQKLVGFLRQGGRALFMQDPTNFLSTQSKNDVNTMLTEWSLKFEDGIVVETNPQYYGADDPRILLPRNQESDIIKTSRYPTVLAFAGGVTATNTTGFVPLLASTEASYLKTNVQEIQANNFGYNQSSDRLGPITVAAAYETAAKDATPANLAVPGGADIRKTRIVLVNSIAWATDIQRGFGLPQSPGNYNLFVNTVNWLAEEKDAVVIAPKQSDSKTFFINQSQDTFIFYSSFLGLPLVVFIIGIVVWWRRR